MEGIEGLPQPRTPPLYSRPQKRTRGQGSVALDVRSQMPLPDTALAVIQGLVSLGKSVLTAVRYFS